MKSLPIPYTNRDDSLQRLGSADGRWYSLIVSVKCPLLMPHVDAEWLMYHGTYT